MIETNLSVETHAVNQYLLRLWRQRQIDFVAVRSVFPPTCSMFDATTSIKFGLGLVRGWLVGKRIRWTSGSAFEFSQTKSRLQQLENEGNINFIPTSRGKCKLLVEQQFKITRTFMK